MNEREHRIKNILEFGTLDRYNKALQKETSKRLSVMQADYWLDRFNQLKRDYEKGLVSKERFENDSRLYKLKWRKYATRGACKNGGVQNRTHQSGHQAPRNLNRKRRSE